MRLEWLYKEGVRFSVFMVNVVMINGTNILWCHSIWTNNIKQSFPVEEFWDQIDCLQTCGILTSRVMWGVCSGCTSWYVVWLWPDGGERRGAPWVETKKKAIQWDMMRGWGLSSAVHQPSLSSLSIYLLGCPFTLCSDHTLLQWLHYMKDANAQITHWYLVIVYNLLTSQWSIGWECIW